MRQDKLTVKSQEAIQGALNETIERGTQEVTAEHLLYALTMDDIGTCNNVLKKLGVDIHVLRGELGVVMDSAPKYPERPGSLICPRILIRY